MKNVLKISFVLILVLVVLMPTHARTIKLLAVGNSFTQDGVEFYLHSLGKATSDTIIIGSFRIGSSALEDHWKNFNTDKAAYKYVKIDSKGIKTELEGQKPSFALTDEDWDYISFQQVSGHSGLYETYVPYLANLLAYVKPRLTNPDVKYLFHQTWAFAKDFNGSAFPTYNRDQDVMYNAILNAVTQLQIDHPEIDMVVPAGTAIQNGRTSFIGDNFCRDGYHLNMQHGRYTAACTWFEALTGKSVIGNTYVPSSVGRDYAIVAQHAAHSAILAPKEVTNLSELLDELHEEELRVSYPVNINFGSGLIAGWNTVTSTKEGYKLNGIMGSNGKKTKINLEVIDDFGGTNKNGPTGINIDTYTWAIPDGASSTSFYGNGLEFSDQVNPTGAIKLTNIDISQSYDIVAFCSNTNSTNNTEVYVEATGFNSKTGYVNSTQNTTKFIILQDIKPTNDSTLIIKAGVGPNNTNSTQFYYLNAIALFPHDEDEIKTNIQSQFSDLEIKKIYVYNSQGQCVDIITDKHNFSHFNGLKGKKPEVYILKIETEQGFHTKMILK